MIGYLSGRLISKDVDLGHCILEVEGVGYEVSVSSSLLSMLPLHQPVALWIHTHIREGVFSLYGFSTEVQKQMFHHLLGVNGLGPKTALSLLGTHDPESLLSHIQKKDLAAICTAPGIGKKVAEKIILDLSPRLSKLFVKFGSSQSSPAASHSLASIDAPTATQKFQDLILALQYLGYSEPQIDTALTTFSGQEIESLSTEAAIKKVLLSLNPRYPDPSVTHGT